MTELRLEGVAQSLRVRLDQLALPSLGYCRWTLSIQPTCPVTLLYLFFH